MTTITKYSIVCQVPDAEPYTFCEYTGVDLAQVLGITQVDMPQGHYGWIQVCGEALVNVSGQAQPAYVDFRPNTAKRQLIEESLKGTQKYTAERSSDSFDEPAHDRLERLSQLPPLLMEAGPYCSLMREARDVFVDGHFYACVAMCGISFERFQRDKAAPYGATRKHGMNRVRSILLKNKVLLPATLTLCKKMAKLRNDYAHGDGLNPREDALKSLAWMHSFIDKETNLMRDYVILNGLLTRSQGS